VSLWRNRQSAKQARHNIQIVVLLFLAEDDDKWSVDQSARQDRQIVVLLFLAENDDKWSVNQSQCAWCVREVSEEFE